MQAADLVVLLLDFEGDTWEVSDSMPRWVAEWELRRIGEYGMRWKGRRVTGALIVPREEKVH